MNKGEALYGKYWTKPLFMGTNFNRNRKRWLVVLDFRKFHLPSEASPYLVKTIAWDNFGDHNQLWILHFCRHQRSQPSWICSLTKKVDSTPRLSETILFILKSLSFHPDVSPWRLTIIKIISSFNLMTIFLNFWYYMDDGCYFINQGIILLYFISAIFTVLY